MLPLLFLLNMMGPDFLSSGCVQHDAGLLLFVVVTLNRSEFQAANQELRAVEQYVNMPSSKERSSS